MKQVRAIRPALHKDVARTMPCFYTTDRLIARWVYAHAVELQPSHVPGLLNAWADEVSRNNLQRFAHRADCRVHFDLRQLAAAGRHVTLHEPSYRWPAELWQAQQARPEKKTCL